MNYTLKLVAICLTAISIINIVGCTDRKPSPSPSPTVKAVAKTPADVLLAKVEKLMSQGVFEELGTTEKDAAKSYKQELAAALIEDERKKIVSKITSLSKIYDRSSASFQANGKQKLANEAKSISLQLDKALASYVGEANKSKKTTP
jgi:hypothetical protein